MLDDEPLNTHVGTRLSALSCQQAQGQRAFKAIFCHITGKLTHTLCRYEYLWEDGSKYRRPTKLPAPEYVDALMNWAQGLLDDESIFPNKIGIEPSCFVP